MDEMGVKVGENESIWADWYDALIGRSYIPDMVTESEIWFDRMGASMTSTTTEATANVGDAFIGLDRQVSGTLARMITSNKLALQDFADFGLDIANQVLAGIIQVGIQSGINFAFAPQAGGTAGGPTPLFPAGTLHTGGIVGEGAATRLVDPSVFAGAQRCHRGGMVLRPGEVPIIAQRGERITPAGQGGGPTMIVNIINQSGAQIEQRQRTGPQGEDIRDILVREVGHATARGDLDAAMGTRFGLRPGR
jgi:hypothetical protein